MITKLLTAESIEKEIYTNMHRYMCKVQSAHMYILSL